MNSSIKVALSYLQIVLAEDMTKDEAQKIVDKMPTEKLNRIKKLLQPFRRLFQKPFSKRDAALIDVVKKINKTTGIPIVELMAVAMITFGAVSPTLADPSLKQDTKTEQVTQKRPVSEVRSELEKVFKLPSFLMKLVKKTPQGLINIKGVGGFIKTVSRNLSKSLTPEVSELLSQIPENQWPEVLSALAVQKIREDSEVNSKFQEFVKHHKTSEANMQREIAQVVSTGKAKIKDIVEKATAKKAYIG